MELDLGTRTRETDITAENGTQSPTNLPQVRRCCYKWRIWMRNSQFTRWTCFGAEERHLPEARNDASIVPRPGAVEARSILFEVQALET